MCNANDAVNLRSPHYFRCQLTGNSPLSRSSMACQWSRPRGNTLSRCTSTGLSEKSPSTVTPHFCKVLAKFVLWRALFYMGNPLLHGELSFIQVALCRFIFSTWESTNVRATESCDNGKPDVATMVSNPHSHIRSRQRATECRSSSCEVFGRVCSLHFQGGDF